MSATSPDRPVQQNRDIPEKPDRMSSLHDEDLSEWLDPDMLARQHKLHDELQQMRSDKACEFLVNDVKFTKWASGTDCEKLVLVGEPGSGKSVAMSFLIDKLRRKQHTRKTPQVLVCYHYCQTGTSDEAAHVYSVLILSLIKLTSRSHQHTMLCDLKGPSTLVSDMTPALGKCLEITLKKIRRPLALIFAIDGLDECDEKSRRHLISSLKAISKENPKIKLLLSTRPEEAILEDLKGTSQILMEANPERDRLIAAKTVETRLPALTDEVKALIVDSLSRSAQGSGVWTTAMINLIAERRMTEPDAIRKFLNTKEPPEVLWRLHANVYSRQTRNILENERLSTAALEVLAVAKRPLSILEVGWAAALGAAWEKPHTVDDLSKLVDCKLVMSLIHPFVARVDFTDMTKCQVKLVHPSVREFVIRYLSFQCVEMAESNLLAICVRYLLLAEIGTTPLFSEASSSLDELPPYTDLFTDTPAPTHTTPDSSWEAWEQDMAHFNPAKRGFGELFVYAACHWVDHLGAVSRESFLPSLAEIETLCRAGSTRLHNWIAQNCRPGCAVKPRFEFDSGLYDPLSIACLYGSDVMLQSMLKKADLSGNGGAYLPKSILKAADQILQWGDLDRIKVLWESRPGHQQLRNLEFFCRVLDRWSKSRAERFRVGWDGVFALLENVCDKMVDEQWGRSVLGKAIVVGCLPVVQVLFEAAKSRPPLMAELRDMNQGDVSLVEMAVWANNADVLKYLLGQLGEYMKAHVQEGDARGRDMLRLAARFCNPAVFRQLVPRLEECVNKRDQAGQTVLDLVVSSGAPDVDRLEVAGILVAWSRFLETGKVEPLVSELRRLMGADGKS